MGSEVDILRWHEGSNTCKASRQANGGVLAGTGVVSVACPAVASRRAMAEFAHARDPSNQGWQAGSQRRGAAKAGWKARLNRHLAAHRHEIPRKHRRRF